MGGYHVSRGSISRSLFDAIVPPSDHEEAVEQAQEESIENTTPAVSVEEEEEKSKEAMEEGEESESNDNSGSSLLIVSEEPLVSIEYTVLTADSGADLPLEAAAAGGVLDVRFVYEGEGWVAFGISRNGQMIGSEAIIGIPSSTEDTTIPEKYNLNGFSVQGIERMSDERQTLIDPIITQEDGIT